MIKNIYIAGPLFNVHETRYLEDIAKELESKGYQCFLPHRDQLGIDDSELEKTEMSEATKDRIFNNDLDALKFSGLSASPLNSPILEHYKPHFITTRKGGDGAFRELAELILKAQNIKPTY